MKQIFWRVLVAGLFWPGNLFAQTAAPAPASVPAKKALVGLSGWVIFNDPGNASLADFEIYASMVDRVYLDAYHSGDLGLPVAKAEATDALKARAVAAARKGKCQPWIMVDGWGKGGGKNSIANGLVNMLHDGTLRQQHIDTLIAFAKKDGADGIQVNYQNLGSKDRGPFVDFVSQLSGACHKNGLLLGVVVIGKTDNWGAWEVPQSVDTSGIGKSVDEMVNQWNQERWGGSPAGPLEDVDGTEANTRFMTSVVPASKTEVSSVVMGYDWVGLNGQEISWAQFQNLLQLYKVTPSRDLEVSKLVTFDYPPGHEVWFSDAKAFEFMADIAKRLQTYGVAFWHFGAEGREFWEMMRRVDASNQATAPLGIPAAPPAPPRLHPVDIYTDKVRVLSFWASGGDGTNPAADSNIGAVEQNGRYWVNITLNGTNWSTAGINMARINLKPFVEHGALQFYIKGSKGGETFPVGFIMAPGLTKEENHAFENLVPLANYVDVTTQWKLVTIPLADFSPSGGYYDGKIGSHINTPFNWARVDRFFISRAAGETLDFQISNIRVVPAYSPKSAR